MDKLGFEHTTLDLQSGMQPLSSWTWMYPALANSVDPDQLVSEEANWSGSTLFVIESSNLISWELEVCVVS